MGDIKLAALGPRGSGRGMCALRLELNVSVTGWQRKSARVLELGSAPLFKVRLRLTTHGPRSAPEPQSVMFADTRPELYDKSKCIFLRNTPGKSMDNSCFEDW